MVFLMWNSLLLAIFTKQEKWQLVFVDPIIFFLVMIAQVVYGASSQSGPVIHWLFSHTSFFHFCFQFMTARQCRHIVSFL